MILVSTPHIKGDKMLNLTLRKVDFNELKIEDIGKRPVLDTLLKFWTKSENEYIEFLQKHNIDFYKNFTSIAELKDTLKQDIETINNIAEQNLENAFDFKTINFLKSKNLKDINDYEFVKLTIDLRQINNAENKELIKDLFLETKSVSLVDFVDVSEHSCSLIYHKKGAFYYNNEPYMCNSRESLTLLENFEIPKDSNFILTRFLLDLSNKFEDNNIDESFCVQYSNGKENIANMHEVIYWGHLNAEEKRELKAEIKEQEAINNEAKQIAKEELKAESNATRDSLKPKEVQEVLEQEKNVRLYNINEINTTTQKPKEVQEVLEKPKNIENKIDDIIFKSIELYKQKEIEKLNVKLEKAQKDSQNAYTDLKEYLNNGLSILEALKNIQQKYRNDDTINLASLLFSKDILNLKSKEDEIVALNKDKEELQTECKEAYSEIDKKEETISKLRSTLQTKLNEMKDFEYELEQEYEIKIKEKEEAMLKELEALQQAQEKLKAEYEEEIKELDTANEELNNENKKINEMNLKLNADNENLSKSLKELESKYAREKEQIEKRLESLDSQNDKIKEENYKLITQNEILQSNLKEQEKELESLQQDLKNKISLSESHTKQLYKLEAKMETFNDKEKLYKEQIQELKDKNQALETRLNNILDNTFNKQAEDKSQKKLRSRDILGD